MSTFFDTNIVVYAFLDSPRQSPARAALSNGGVISVQVLNEFTNVSRKKHHRPWDEIETAVAILRTRLDPVLPLTVETHASAIALARDHSLSFYDALIVASALDAGCTTLLTEDMQHGRAIGTLTIRNPFL